MVLGRSISEVQLPYKDPAVRVHKGGDSQGIGDSDPVRARADRNDDCRGAWFCLFKALFLAVLRVSVCWLELWQTWWESRLVGSVQP